VKYFAFANPDEDEFLEEDLPVFLDVVRNTFNNVKNLCVQGNELKIIIV